MKQQMQVTKLDNGRWVVEFLSHTQYNHETKQYDYGEFWGSFEDQTQHATKREAMDEMNGYIVDNAREAAAERRYQSQIAYACGERD